MEPDLSPLDAHLSALGVDAYLIDADSTDSNQRYLSGFDAPDPFLTCYTPEECSLLVSGLGYGRAKTESRADRVDRPVAYDKRALVDAYGVVEGLEGDDYVPHVTLARGGSVVDVERVAGEIEGVSWTVSELVIWDSRYREAVSRYSLPA